MNTLFFKQSGSIVSSVCQLLAIAITLYWLIDVIFEPSLWIGFVLIYGTSYIKTKYPKWTNGFWGIQILGCLIVLYWLLGVIFEPSLWLAFALFAASIYLDLKTTSSD